MSTDGKAFWDRLTPAYQEVNRISVSDFHYGPLLPGDATLQLLPALDKNSSCLELGCGAGQNSIFLNKQFGADCVAIDFSQAQLSAGQKIAKEHDVTVHFLCEDIEKLESFDLGEFDLIHSCFGLPFLKDPEPVIQAAAKKLKPGGTLLISMGHPLHSGEWVEIEEGETALVLADYYNPVSDDRRNDAGEQSVSHYFPIGDMVAWFVKAGLVIADLQEPPPMAVNSMTESEIEEYVPYYSEGWAENFGELCRIPLVVIIKATKTLL